jgi:hypothetical protein
MPENPYNNNPLNSPSIEIDARPGEEQEGEGDDFKSELERKRTELRKQSNAKLNGMLDQVSSVLNRDKKQDSGVKNEIDANIANMKKELNFDVNSV